MTLAIATEVREKPYLNERDQIIYAMLRKAAEMGDECPSNAFLAGAAGYSAANTVCTAVKRLQDRGYIKVERFMRSRRVTIVETGEQTRHINEEVPHWRLRGASKKFRDNIKNEIAEHVANGRSINGAGRLLNICQSRAHKVFGEIKRDLGWQAA